MRGFDDIPSAMAEIKDLLSRGRRAFERQLLVLVDPVSRDGDRFDVSVAGESVDLADNEVLWNGRNPDSTWTLDGGVVWVRWAGNADPVNEIVSD